MRVGEVRVGVSTVEVGGGDAVLDRRQGEAELVDEDVSSVGTGDS
jgi:hypothetical protein